MKNRLERSERESSGNPLKVDIIRIYFDDAFQSPLLTHQEEITLGKVIRANRDEEAVKQAKQSLIKSNLRLVHRLRRQIHQE